MIWPKAGFSMRFSKAAGLLLVLFAVSGCTMLGPDFGGIKSKYASKSWNRSSSESIKNLSDWWKLFDDPVLNKLVNITYRQNLDIKSAGLRIVQARAALGISEGLAFPQKQTLSGVASSSAGKPVDVASAGVNFDIGWEMDIWGKYARGIESSQASLYASVASYNSIMVSVISEVARNYINYRTAQERLAYAKRNIAIQERVTRLTEVQFNSGNVSELDMQQSRTQLYSTKAILPSLELIKIKSRNAMAVLMAVDTKYLDRVLKKSFSDTVSSYITNSSSGQMQLSATSGSELEVKLIPKARFNPHYKIDANLLRQRPDIQVAEYIAHANSAKIGSAVAELYPSFSLFGNIGINSNNASGSWVSAGNALGVSIGPSFSWNIFQYGRIKNTVRLQDAIFEESLVAYNKKVLSAASEVSDALNGYLLSKQQTIENRKAVESAVRAFNISVIQYNDGLVGYERLLTTVKSLTLNQDSYAQNQGALASNVVSLYKALGGGWQMSRGKSYLSAESAGRMKKRVNWDRYLDPDMTRLPEDMQ